MTAHPILAPPVRDPQRAGAAPSFSILIAVHQGADCIAEALESALGQTLAPLEVVVCDDGSTDDLDAALEPFVHEIVLLRQENRGEAAAKNAAARAAHGEFVVILDADDLFAPTRLEALAQLAIERPDLDVLTTNAVLEVDGEVVRRCYTAGLPFEVVDQRHAILERNFIFGLAAVRRTLLLDAGGFDERIRYATDWDLWIRLILGGAAVGLVDAPLARYRLRRTSLSAQRALLMAGRVQVLHKAAERDDLSVAERRVVERSLAVGRRDLALAQAREALLEGRSDARRRALAVALGRGQSARSRIKAAATALAPGVARRRLAPRPRETTGGVQV